MELPLVIGGYVTFYVAGRHLSMPQIWPSSSTSTDCPTEGPPKESSQIIGTAQTVFYMPKADRECHQEIVRAEPTGCSDRLCLSARPSLFPLVSHGCFGGHLYKKAWPKPPSPPKQPKKPSKSPVRIFLKQLKI
jgi:hypothetical protein